jgi:4-amino-4-deoxy-L-arabinose transferase-like glycosyltransferase
MRLRSFEDFKLPLYTYLSVPFVAVMGLNDLSIRIVNIILGVSLVPLMFLVAYQLFKNKYVALIASFLVAQTPWVYILTRHAHEGVAAAFCLLLALYFLLKFKENQKIRELIFVNIFAFLASFSYQSGRIFLFFFVIYQIYLCIFETKKRFTKENGIRFIMPFIVLLLAIIPDMVYGVSRVANLLFIKSPGFSLRLVEYLNEHPFRPLHNKLWEAIREITDRYFTQISPDFFLINGDKNWRFGYAHLGLITPIEFILFFVGIFFLFKNKVKHKEILLLLLAIAPIGNALTWQEQSLIRTYFMIFPMILVIAYGIFYGFRSLATQKLKIVVSFLAVGGMYFYLFNNWDMYFFHYPKRAAVTVAWQCGYKELADYVKNNTTMEHFVITDRLGQPYIFLLYYLHYDPTDYQSQAKMTAPDKYGFGQVEKFDKYEFKFRYDPHMKKTAFIGYPDEFAGNHLIPTKKIIFNGENVFWIYEQN